MFDIKYVPFENSVIIKITFYYDGDPLDITDTFIVSAKEDVDKIIQLINDKAYSIQCVIWDENTTFSFRRITYNVEIGYLSEHLIRWRELDLKTKTLK